MNKGIGRLKTLAFLVTFSFLLGSCRDGNNSGVGEDALKNFSGACRSSVGDWTNQALSHTQSLIGVLERLRDSEEAACRGVASALAQAQNINQQLSRLALSPESVALRTQEERRSELVATLERMTAGEETSPDMVASLRQELFLIELDLAQSKAELSVSRDAAHRRDIINGLGQISSYVSSLLNNGNLASCLNSSPMAPFEIGSSLLSIGGNFTSATIGATLSTIGNLMSQTFSFLRSLPTDNAIIDFEDIQTQAALTCSIETMSNLYCDAETSHRLIRFALDNYDEEAEPTPIWAGMELLGNDLPILNRWLAKIANGVDPTDEHAADRLNEVWDKQNEMRKIRNLVAGEINKTKRLLERVTSDRERELRIRSAFKKIVGHMYASERGGPSGGGPIKEFVGPVAAVCRISGDADCADQDTDQWNWERLIDDVAIVDGFAGIEDRTQILLDEVGFLINKELQETISQDPELLLGEAIQPNNGKPSPLEVLEQISRFSEDFVTYMEENSSRPGDRRVIAVARSTKRIVDSAVAKILDYETTSGEVIQHLFQELRLLENIQYLTQRVHQLVGWDIEMRVRNGDIADDVRNDLLSSGKNVIEQLERTGLFLEEDADELISDLRNAQHVSTRNLNTSIEFFASTIDKALKAIKETAVDSGETSWSDPSYYRLAQFCILVLTTSLEWPEGVDRSTCSGAVLESAYSNSGIRLSFDELWEEFHASGGMAPFKSRVCTYPEFLRASRLFRTGRSQEVWPERQDQPTQMNSEFMFDFLGL